MIGRVNSISMPPPRIANNASSSGLNQTSPGVPSSTRVTLSNGSNEINAIYSMSAMKLGAAKVAGNSQVDLQMAANLSQSGPNPFAGVGKALLLQLKESPKDFTSVVASPNAADKSAEVSKNSAGAQASAVAFDIVTQTGVKVSISLAHQEDGMVAQITTTGGELTEAETTAITGLADAFQKTLDGLSNSTPNVDLEGLTKFNTQVLKSVDLATDIRQGSDSLQSLSYHADSTQRSVDYKDGNSSFQLDTDLSHPERLGTVGQQDRALAAYAKQLDDAKSRGHGDNTLINAFKETFRALNSNYGSNELQANQSKANQSIMLMSEDDKSRGYLSGLADFKASFQQADISSNPYKKEEKDTFSYSFSQTSNSTNLGDDNGTLRQQTTANLRATYHESLTPGTPLKLTDDKFSQNYTYHQIDDQTTTSTALDFKQGLLASVTSSQTTHNLESVKKYVSGRLTEETQTPYDNQQTQQKKLLTDGIQLQKKPGKLSLI